MENYARSLGRTTLRDVLVCARMSAIWQPTDFHTAAGTVL